MTLSFLQQWHRYLILACEHPAPDEDVNELRRLNAFARCAEYCRASGNVFLQQLKSLERRPRSFATSWQDMTSLVEED